MITTRQPYWHRLAALGGLILLCSATIISLQLPRLNRLKSASSDRSPQQLQNEVTQEALELNLLKVFAQFWL